MSNGAGSEKAGDAVRLLRQKWEQTAYEWRDDAARSFEAEQVRALQAWGEAAAQLAASTESVMANLRQIAP
jgi:hypothetical protein